MRSQQPSRVVGIYIYQGKAYVPHQALLDIGVFIDIDPVIISEITREGLVSAISRVLDEEIRVVSTPPRDNTKSRKDPLLKATGAKNWKEVAKKGASYTIEFLNDKINLYVSKLDNRGRWKFDTSKTMSFDPNSTLITITEAIISDLSSDQTKSIG